MESDPELLSTSKLHKRLMNKAVHYLGRYQASQKRLRQILQQFARRKLNQPSQTNHYSDDEISAAIEQVISLCLRYGYIDDSALALSRARSSVQAGQSAYQLAGKLRQMGLAQDMRAKALRARSDDHQHAEKAAALRAMRKKRLGPFHPDYDNLAFEDQQKQLAKLARLGFSADLIRQILAIPTPQEAELALEQAEAPAQDSIRGL
ncbi:MAG: regulatory protein RecX [Candidatus Puniceispirillaceae bacterium]